MTRSIIHDGFTEKGTINEVPRLHGPLTFSWRPMTCEQRAEYAEAAGRCSGGKWKRLQAEVMSRQVVSWDLRIDDGPVSISPANLLRLKPRLFDRMFLIVLGDDTPDSGPDDAPAEEISQEAKDLLEALESKRTPGDIKRDRLQGN